MQSETPIATIFDVWVTYDTNRGRPHYPCYNTKSEKIGSALSREDAESILNAFVSSDFYGVDYPIHHFSIKEYYIGCIAFSYDSLSEYVYDANGALLDKREYENSDGFGYLHGRKPEEIRFQPGEICEFLSGDDVLLGIIADIPMNEERASYLNTHFRNYTLDEVDGHYLIVSSGGERCFGTHIDSINVFKPKYKYLPQTEARLKKALADYRTRPIRMAIEGITYEEKLKELLEYLGLEATIRLPEWEGGWFSLGFEKLIPFSKVPFTLTVTTKQAKTQLNRVRVTLSRMAGAKEKGRGFKPHLLTSEEYKYDEYKTYALM